MKTCDSFPLDALFMFGFPLDEADLVANKNYSESFYVCLSSHNLRFQVNTSTATILTPCKRPVQTQVRESQLGGREVAMKSHPLAEELLALDCSRERESQCSLML